MRQIVTRGVVKTVKNIVTHFMDGPCGSSKEMVSFSPHDLIECFERFCRNISAENQFSALILVRQYEKAVS